MSGYFELQNVSKGFGPADARNEVLSHIHLDVPQGEFLAIVGFSGSGKTTLISLMAGLLEPDEGEVLLEGAPMPGPGPDRGIVFQNYSLLPWLTVFGNIMLGVQQVFGDWTKDQREQHVLEALEMVNLSPAREKYPIELSGGMRQRVAVARALAIDPKILLLDEPLSALDALTRSTLQDEIESIWRKQKKTVVLITNDVDEAILLADRIIPLNPGPKASLGPEFAVPLDRPRDRKEINHNAEFRKIRNEVTEYLLEVGGSNSAATAHTRRHLPDLTPMDLRPPTRPSRA